METNIQATKHAKDRAVQRGIPPLILEWLEGYGSHVPDGRGCEIVWFDKKSRARLAKAVGKQVVDRLSPLLDAYAVMTSAGVFITTGWLQQRILAKG